MSKVRISVANLAPRLRVGRHGAPHYFGLLNRKAFEKGRRLLTALGGAALMTPQGITWLESTVKAELQEGSDARLVVKMEYLEQVLRQFEARDPEFCELDPRREITEELATKELPIQDRPVVSPVDLSDIDVVYVATVRQPLAKSGKSTSARETDIPSRRLFYLFDLIVTPAILTKFEASPAVAMLNEEEVATTDGGTQKGLTSDGAAIGDNIFLF